MGRKIYYITRTFTHDAKTGGALMREGAVSQFIKHGFDVEVVSHSRQEGVSYLDGYKLSLFNNGDKSDKFNWTKQRFGVCEDYLDCWADNCTRYLREVVKNGDILFSTTGGDLATLKIASIIKKDINCIYIANFRDPVLHTSVNGVRLSPFLHVNRDKMLDKYISNADLLVTSSNDYREVLERRYIGKVINNHFGYLSNEDDIKVDFNFNLDALSIVYAGTLNKYQGPELYSEIFNGLRNVDLTIYTSNDLIKNCPDNIQIHSPIPRNLLYTKVSQQHNVGFVSLSHPYFSVCIPSKIYEYINIGLPIFGFLPKGEARDIVNDNGFGYIADVNNLKELRKKLCYYAVNIDELSIFHDNIAKKQDLWSMEYLFIQLVKEIEYIKRDLL